MEKVYVSKHNKNNDNDRRGVKKKRRNRRPDTPPHGCVEFILEIQHYSVPTRTLKKVSRDRLLPEQTKNESHINQGRNTCHDPPRYHPAAHINVPRLFSWSLRRPKPAVAPRPRFRWRRSLQCLPSSSKPERTPPPHNKRRIVATMMVIKTK